MFINFGNTNNTSFVIVINKSKETQKKLFLTHHSIENIFKRKKFPKNKP